MNCRKARTSCRNSVWAGCRTGCGVLHLDKKSNPLQPRLLLILIFALLIRQSLPAQPAQGFNFTHYSTANGLLSNQVNAVVQDETGYIWIGTTDGLARF